MKKLMILAAIMLVAVATPSFAQHHSNPFITSIGVGAYGLGTSSPGVYAHSNVLAQVATATGFFVTAVGSYLEPGSTITGAAGIKSSDTATVTYNTTATTTSLSMSTSASASSFVKFSGTIADE